VPRFFIHHVEHELALLDEEGAEFPDLAAARAEVIAAGREMLARLIKEGRIVDGRVLEIWDEDGNHLDTIKLRDLVLLS
jgi:hypothetical protein